MRVASRLLILRTAMLFRPLRISIPVVLLCLLYGAVKMSIDMMRDPNISVSACWICWRPDYSASRDVGGAVATHA